MDLTTLVGELQRFGVANLIDQSGQFRSALNAIINQLHDDDGVTAHRSLQDWWQWLEDSGYEPRTVASVLSKVANGIIGESAKQELEAFILSNITEAAGLPLLIDHVQSFYPQLAITIEKLEALAISEQQEIEAFAGGMDKGAKIALISGATVGVSILFGAVVVKGRNLLREKAELAVQAEYDNLIHQSVREKEHLWLFAENGTKSEVDKAISDPGSAIRIANSIHQFGPDEIEKHAELLTL